MLVPIAIYIFLPILGIAGYWILVQWMRRAGVPLPPVIPFFVLFFTLGGWLQVLLTALLWEWSGLASMGVLYLLVIAPILTLAIARQLRSRRRFSNFHRWAFFLNIAYSCSILVTAALAGIRFAGR
jgi:hypothetical protein